jgi:hypothetical protein
MIRSLSDFIFCIGVICLVFITKLTAPFLGITQVITASSSIIFFLSVSYIFKNINILNQKNNKSIVFYAVAILLISFKITFMSGDLFIGLNYLKGWLLPVFLLLYFENLCTNKRNILQKVLIFLFLVECLLGLYERITTTLVFGIFDQNNVGVDESDNINIVFRAESLFEHPLNNAHLICVMIGVILNSSIKANFVYILLIIGILGILSFNARGATIFVSLVVIIYFKMRLNYLNNKERNSFIFLFLGGIGSILYLVFNSSLGGRLIYGGKVLDSSAQARFGVLDTFKNFYNHFDPILGTNNLGAFSPTENGYLNMIMSLGIPFAILLIYSQSNILFSRFRNFKSDGVIIILICFFLVGSTNNNLDKPASFTMLCIWLSAFKITNFKSPQQYPILQNQLGK